MRMPRTSRSRKMFGETPLPSENFVGAGSSQSKSARHAIDSLHMRFDQ